MIKPKYKKGLDVSQLARAAVEQAIGAPLKPTKIATVQVMAPNPKTKRPSAKRRS